MPKITQNSAFECQATPMLYTLTFWGAGGYDKTTFKVVANSAEAAIRTALEQGLKDNEKDYEVRWVSTESHVDLISDEGPAAEVIELKTILQELLESTVYADAEGGIDIEHGGADDAEHREIVARCQAILKREK